MRYHEKMAVFRKPLPFILSISLHAVMFYVIYAVSSMVQKPPPPLVIDLTISSGGESGKGASCKAAAAGPRRVSGKRDASVEKVHAATRAEPERRPAPVPVPVQAAIRTAGPQVIAGPAQANAQVGRSNGASVASKAEASGAAGGSGAGSSAGQTSAQGGKGGGQGSGMSGEQLRNGYLKEHFAYIKDIIQRNINYPPRARRMGWTGNVVVSFVINENGHASDEKILKSSGFEVLDSNVIATIRSVSPFPRPPVKAQLRVPINYQLE